MTQPLDLENIGWPFNPPDSFWELLGACRDRDYRKKYLRWVIHGPNEEHDAACFDQQWEEAGEAGRPWVQKYYEDQRTARLTGLTHVKTDVQTLFNQVGLLFVVVTTIVALSSPVKIQHFWHSPNRYVLLLPLLAWVLASSSYTARLFYSLWTHFMGVAERGRIITGSKSYVNSLRKEVNGLSLTLQRARRRLDLSKVVIYVTVIFLFRFILFG